MKIDVPEGAIPAPDELDTAKTSELEVNDKAETDDAKDEAEAPEAETTEATEAAETPPAAPIEEPEDEPAKDEAPAEIKETKETKSQRKRRLRREREEQLWTEIVRKNKQIEDLTRRAGALKDIDPTAAENYDAANAQNAVNTAMRAQTEAQIETVKAEREMAEGEAKEAAIAAWEEQVAELAHIKDFAQKVYDLNAPFTAEIAAAVTQMERGPEIAYALANDHERLKRLNRLSPIQLGAELARIEAGLTLPRPKTTSSAPKPIKPLKGSTTAPDVNLESADYATFKKLRGFG